jgi:hypothetical protein
MYAFSIAGATLPQIGPFDDLGTKDPFFGMLL